MPGQAVSVGTEFLTASTESTGETSLTGHPQRVEFTVRELGPVAGPSVLVSKEDSIQMLHYRLPTGDESIHMVEIRIDAESGQHAFVTAQALRPPPMRK